MGWIHIEYKDIDTIEWEKIEQFELCEIFKKSEGKDLGKKRDCLSVSRLRTAVPKLLGPRDQFCGS